MESNQNLLDLIEELQEKYQGALEDIKRLEEENIENTNLIYELMENVRALDARIDILASEPYTISQFSWINDNTQQAKEEFLYPMPPINPDAEMSFLDIATINNLNNFSHHVL
jgi:predicted nuclease with TOPRIM domain